MAIDFDKFRNLNIYIAPGLKLYLLAFQEAAERRRVYVIAKDFEDVVEVIRASTIRIPDASSLDVGVEFQSIPEANLGSLLTSYITLEMNGRPKKGTIAERVSTLFLKLCQYIPRKIIS